MDTKGGSMKKVLVRGPILSRSGYGEHARFLLRSLRAYEDSFDIYAVTTNWGNTGWLWEDDEERRWTDKILKKTAIEQHNGIRTPANRFCKSATFFVTDISRRCAY